MFKYIEIIKDKNVLTPQSNFHRKQQEEVLQYSDI
jgi:hypothetical protein